MKYNSKITEQKPSLIVMMIDQSGSMNEQYGGEQIMCANNNTKAQIVAEATNMMIMDLLARCRQGAVHKRYFDIAVIGYSAKGVYSLLHDTRYILSPTELVASIKQEQRNMRKVKDANGTEILQYNSLKIWVEPYADGQTPMLKAFEKTTEIIAEWKTKQKQKDQFPPIIINITDGEPTDATPEKLIQTKNKIQKLNTLDGEPLIFNFHISSLKKTKVLFPLSKEEIPPDGKLLYNLSSNLPPIYNDQIAALRQDVDIEKNVYRAFTYNLPTADFIKALQIGTATTRQINK